MLTCLGIIEADQWFHPFRQYNLGIPSNTEKVSYMEIYFLDNWNISKAIFWNIFCLTILTGKYCFIQLSKRMPGGLLLTFFDMFTQSIKLYYTLHYHVLGLQMFEKCDSSNWQEKWMVALSRKFYGKIWVGFCLNTGKRFFIRGFILKPAERA